LRAGLYRLTALACAALAFSCQHSVPPVQPLPDDRVVIKEGAETLLYEGDYAELIFVESSYVKIEKITTEEMLIRILGDEEQLITVPEQGYAPMLALRIIRLREGEAVVKMQHDFLF